MLIRLCRHTTQATFNSGTTDEFCSRIQAPETVILVLKGTHPTPPKISVEISAPGGHAAFDIPVLRMKVYTLEDILDRRLFFLIPFYIFTKESEPYALETDANEMDELVAEYNQIMKRLDAEVVVGNIAYEHMQTITEISKIVLERVTRGYTGVREKVSATRRGTVLEHGSKTIFNKGYAEGIALGREEVRTEMLRHLLENGLDVEYLARITGIDVAEIERVRNATSAGPKE